MQISSHFARAATATAAAITLVASGASAQEPQFRQLPVLDHAPGSLQAFFASAASTGAPAPDVVLVGAGGVQHLANDGAGRLTTAGEVVGRRFHLSVLADVDGDGDDDLVVVAEDTPNLRELNVYRWQNGAFVKDPAVAINAFNAGYILPGDVDGDGDIDFVLDNSLLPPLLLRNDGTGMLTVLGGRFNVPIGRSRAALADVDGDGDLDLVRHIDSDYLRVYTNNGNGRFFPSPLVIGPQVPFSAKHVWAGDYDADGDTDIAVEAFGLAGNYGTWILYNDGSGNMQTASTRIDIPGGFTSDRLLADLDGDSRQEYLQCFGAGWRVLRRVLGQWIDVTSTVLPPAAQSLPVVAVAHADLDSDGYRDLVAVLDSGRRVVLFGTPTGGFDLAFEGAAPLDSAAVNAVAVADLDGDGRDEVLCASDRGLLFYSISDTGGLRPMLPPVAISGVLHDVLVADFDNNGTLDIAVGGLAPGMETVQVWSKIGGSYSSLPIDPAVVALGAGDLAAGDLNGDGTQELAIAAGFEARVLVIRSGWTVPIALPVQGISVTEIIDIDRDGDLELLVSGAGGLRVLENQVPGLFQFVDVTQGVFAPIATWGGSLACGDIDGDGDSDLVLQGYIPGAPFSGLVLYTNNGAGQYSGSFLGGISTTIASMFVEDVDLDGIADLVLATLVAGESAVRFGAPGAPPSAVPGRSALALKGAAVLADLDRDGDLDLLAARDAADRFAVLTNVARQVRQPDRAAPGGSVSVELTWRPGTASSALCLPILGVRALPLGIAIAGLEGRLFVDPVGVVGLPFTVVGGTRALTVPIPPLPSLSGQPYHVQAVWVDGRQLQWSNVCTGVVR